MKKIKDKELNFHPNGDYRFMYELDDFAKLNQCYSEYYELEWA